MMTPWGMYMNPSRTDGLKGVALPASAQLKLSRKGSASVAPIPFRHVRRLIRMLFSMGRGCELFRDPALCERITRDDFSNESLHAIAVLGDVFHQVIHHDFVIAFQLAAQGIGQ